MKHCATCKCVEGPGTFTFTHPTTITYVFDGERRRDLPGPVELSPGTYGVTVEPDETVSIWRVVSHD